MVFTSCIADTYCCRRSEVKPEGADYYQYVMNYVDYIIAVCMDAVGILEEIAQFSWLNNNKIDQPLDYLGAVLVKN